MYTAGFLESDIWSDEIGIEGWGVRVLNETKSSYQPIISTINNKPVTIMQCTYANCQNVNKISTMPESIIDMGAAFGNCSIQYAPAVPVSVTHMSDAFANCVNLKEVIIHANPVAYNGCLTCCQESIILSGTSSKLNSIKETIPNENDGIIGIGSTTRHLKNRASARFYNG